MTDQEIANAVQTIVAAIPVDKPPTQVEAAALAAGVVLVTNFLQNINTLAKGRV